MITSLTHPPIRKVCFREPQTNAERGCCGCCCRSGGRGDDSAIGFRLDRTKGYGLICIAAFVDLGDSHRNAFHRRRYRVHLNPQGYEHPERIDSGTGYDRRFRKERWRWPHDPDRDAHHPAVRWWRRLCLRAGQLGICQSRPHAGDEGRMRPHGLHRCGERGGKL